MYCYSRCAWFNPSVESLLHNLWLIHYKANTQRSWNFQSEIKSPAIQNRLQSNHSCIIVHLDTCYCSCVMTSILLLTFLVWCCRSDSWLCSWGTWTPCNSHWFLCSAQNCEEYDKQKTKEIKEQIRRNLWAKMPKLIKIMWRHFPAILRSSPSLELFLHSDQGEGMKSFNWGI